MSFSSRRLIDSHPIAIAITVTTILFLVGGFFVLQRAGRAPLPGTSSWGQSTITLQNPIFGGSAPAPQGGGLIPFSGVDVPLGFVPVEGAGAPAHVLLDAEFESFLAHIKRAGTSASTSSKNAVFDAQMIATFLYKPQGLLSTTTKARTPAQEALHRFGNAAGASVKRFESSHGTMLQVLTAFTENRTNPAAAAGLRALAKDFADLGLELRAIAEVPESARVAHEALASGYIDVGEKLRIVASGGSDEEYVAAINTYNAAAEAFTRHFVALTAVFSISGVRFGSHEGGSVFMFPGSGL